MKIGLYPGSFDPITKGHIGVIEKGAKLFDLLYVCILKNELKHPLFSEEDRLEMIKRSVKHLSNVKVVVENSLTVEACKKYNASFILRGLRNSSDFDFELESNNVNQTLDSSITTILVMANPSESHISSSVVRELLSYNSLSYEKMVPEEVFKFIESQKFNNKKI